MASGGRQAAGALEFSLQPAQLEWTGRVGSLWNAKEEQHEL
jgi:hypothetical protein